MVDIASGLASLKIAFDLSRDLKSATEAYNNAEIRLKVSDLYLALSDVKVLLADAQIEMQELKAENLELKMKLTASSQLKYDDSVYWRVPPVEGRPNGPFCPKCYEGKKQESSMSTVSGHFRTFGKYKCNSCNQYVK